jgi:uncharacterized membrane protein YqaE (UPF0057 family)
MPGFSFFYVELSVRLPVGWPNCNQARGIRMTATTDTTMNDLIKIIIAILLPPLGVFLEVGLTKHFWLNILLTILGYVPGIVHAVYIIAKR